MTNFMAYDVEMVGLAGISRKRGLGAFALAFEVNTRTTMCYISGGSPSTRPYDRVEWRINPGRLDQLKYNLIIITCYLLAASECGSHACGCHSSPGAPLALFHGSSFISFGAFGGLSPLVN